MDEAGTPQDVNAGVRIRLSMPRRRWGEWEHPRFDYGIENASDREFRIWKEEISLWSNSGGMLLRVADNQGHRFELGGPHKLLNSPTAHDEQQIAPGHIFWCEYGSLNRRFGKLVDGKYTSFRPGKYTLQMTVLPGFLFVDREPTPQAASGLLAFEVVAETDAMLRSIATATSDLAGVELELTGQTMNYHLGRPNVRLVNRSNESVWYWGHDGTTDVPAECDEFLGDGIWQAVVVLVCGLGQPEPKKYELKPGQSIATFWSAAPRDGLWRDERYHSRSYFRARCNGT